jgi:hypothetical protein
MGKVTPPDCSGQIRVGTTSPARWSALILLLVWLISGVYMGMNLNRGWQPHDEGTLGQIAERVLNGEMPHRDFDDPYTGGLGYIDAFLFRLFGINLFWLRLFLFAFFLAWVPAVYEITRKFLKPWAAGGVTLVAVAWSVPNYPAAMPSWFNLFFATFGILAIGRYISRPAVHWLVVAGLCGGFSFLIKSVGLYYIAGGLLFFVYREQSFSRSQDAPPRKTPLYLAFLLLCLFVFVCALIKLVFAIAGPPEYLHFVFPGLAIALWLAIRERVPPTVSSRSRFKSLFGMATPFLVAAAVPIGLFFIFYWHRGGLTALLNGLFVTPLRRELFARQGPPGLFFEYFSIVAALFLQEAAKLRGQLRRFLSIFLAVFAAVVLLTSRSQDASYLVAIGSAWGIIPVLVVAALLVLSGKRYLPESGAEGDQQLVLLLTMAALCSLIQFPFANVIYFCYTAPIAILLAANLISRLPRPPRMVLYAMTAFYILFAVFVVRVNYFGSFHADNDGTPLMLPRTGGLYVSSKSAAEYGELIPFVEGLSGGRPILAGPNCPEVYFLSGIKNPTPVLFDFFQDPHDYERDMKSLMDRTDFVRVVVINDSSPNSTDQLHVLRSLVSTRFPESRKIGEFTVYWRA